MVTAYFYFVAGDEAWPPGCNLMHCSGENLSLADRVMVEALQSGEMTDVSIEMHSPTAIGVYPSQWRMSTPTGLYFGGKSKSCTCIVNQEIFTHSVCKYVCPQMKERN